MPVLGLISAYTCSSRYGPSYQCSAAQFWSGWVILGVFAVIALIGAVTHQGVRYRRGRSSVFGWWQNRRQTGMGTAPLTQVPLTMTGNLSHRAQSVVPESSTFLATPEPSVAPPSAGVPSGSPPAPSAPIAPAGWYSNPADPSDLRYWDGSSWTAPGAVAPGAPPKPASAPPAWAEKRV